MTLRVVIMDANADVAAGIADLLRTYDIEVETAADAETAWRLIKELVPSLVIVDIYDRPGSGRSLVQDLQRGFPELPILLTSPTRPNPDDLAALSGPRTTFLGKPFTGETLVEAITRLI